MHMRFIPKGALKVFRLPKKLDALFREIVQADGLRWEDSCELLTAAKDVENIFNDTTSHFMNHRDAIQRFQDRLAVLVGPDMIKHCAQVQRKRDWSADYNAKRSMRTADLVRRANEEAKDIKRTNPRLSRGKIAEILIKENPEEYEGMKIDTLRKRLTV